MQFTTCTSRTGHMSREFATCRLTNDMQFTISTTRKPLFHDPYDPYESYELKDTFTTRISSCILDMDVFNSKKKSLAHAKFHKNPFQT